ncbi:uncharacterized protein KQ657_000221 [Scheffersomyces spartinae]|uniref:Amino acid permease/ SLC12A domain-containing protein n=1 Tax=Scheffersomyces spartinae TaxID=45513 RepID=A0A9P7VEZ2_9ASCO|nr:uncharacterized protein KQ657_000221 [Scheffersomyces spartinae]KAG7196208.1 hypothetical protein KQ657_000221 [Scheffersomyces spartinae]
MSILKNDNTLFNSTLDLERSSTDSQENGGPRAVGDGKQPLGEDNLNRSLSVRQINMITIAGVIGTGLFLGTGVSLSRGGPGALLICYTIIGIMVYFTMLSLGEMATQYPVSGSFTTYAKRFGSDSLGFAILSNYWLNDALSVASDLTALQLLLSYWTDFHYWVVALIFWFFLLFLNVFHVRFYGEAEYLLALLKVIAIIIFFIISIVVNAGHNIEHKYIGFSNWGVGDAPFVNGFRGFAKVFVTAAYAYGGTESITMTAGEQKNPTRTMPKIVRTVFWRILIFYILTVFFIGMNIPYNYENLNKKSIITSPFTIMFKLVGAKGGADFMNAVIITSVISAGNHALYAGSRLAYNLGTQGYAPKILTKVNRWKTPYIAVIFTWFFGGLGFGSSFIGAGELWNWLQAIIGLSNLISWWVIGIISIRFRQGLKFQGREGELLFPNWTYPWGPWFVVIFGTFIIFVQGWSTLSPFSANDFFQSYLELAIFPLCYIAWFVWTRCKDKFVKVQDMDFESDLYYETPEDQELNAHLDSLTGLLKFKYVMYENFT